VENGHSIDVHDHFFNIVRGDHQRMSFMMQNGSYVQNFLNAGIIEVRERLVEEDNAGFSWQDPAMQRRRFSPPESK